MDLDSESERNVEEYGDSSKNNLLSKCIMKVIIHPIDYARFLAQVCNKYYSVVHNNNYLICIYHLSGI